MLRGSRIFVSTPGSSVGIAGLNIGRVKVSALSSEPLRMASIIARVSLMEIRLPVPFQPVLTRYACAPAACIRFTSTSAYWVGCSDRNAAPKQAEKVGVGSVMPRSVPASLAVKPEEVVLGLIGSQTRNRRQHTKGVCCQENNFSCVARFGNRLNDVIDVIDRIRNAGVLGFEPSSKSIVPSSRTVTFSSSASRRIAL